ncbi:PREDICTED: LEAF RUST 10 DISEASE-RESISTANCE LOCUS RECEPTOR-LIKE PROTEIN KINASE-like 2.4 [Lupinus angustifolius]|uniref:LEAF RUST 10 DISEASE-RESISTANCE LOCUS RECEPTOR-LIKE PROTEIN KINASE-like 2.4 n=1 Tax=Lupinus angustifolius TaxID=3871 RepID=UPI00092E6081|nr:PREDICTED: LEAF RUST 10 DISEASE-RESISTANCE LOCUS RECEPTOR-LIKE PROTEIN KINASE-like 2.4 [Lupinus angustifolius]
MKTLLLHSYPFFFFIATSIILTNITSHVSANDYTKCYATNTYSCGTITNLTYPFSGGTRPEYCGEPNLKVNCENHVPKFTVNSVTYRIIDWDLKTQNLKVARDDLWDTVCLTSYHATSFENTVFYFNGGLANVTVLLYDCTGNTQPTPNSEDCGGGKYVYYGAGVLPTNYCKSIIVPISGTLAQDVAKDESIIPNTLKDGFELRWDQSYAKCSTCVETGGVCGNNDAQFGCFCNNGTLCQESKKNSRMVMLIATTVSAALVIGVLIIMIYIFRRRLWFHKMNQLWNENSKAHQDFEAFLKTHGPLGIRRYSYIEIKKMTNSFSEKLGQGGYGGVFKGKLHDQRLVAVKMLNKSKGNGDEFINEVASISRTSHINIVTLLGFCYERCKRALIYEYMSNGSLEKFIYQTNPNIVNNQLNWETLYQIAIGVSRGLEYLHKGCNTRIFHFDIKPHNILLDDNFIPKISDFGLAKISPKNESMISMLGARGTPGYIAPEVFSRNIGVVSHKSDVYSFGMMVLEMVGGRKNMSVEVDCTSEIYFPYWIYKRIELNEDIPLKNITNESDEEMMRKMVIVSLWCIQNDPSTRPTMRIVVDMLEGKVETLEIPPKPFFSSPSRSSCDS